MLIVVRICSNAATAKFDAAADPAVPLTSCVSAFAGVSVHPAVLPVTMLSMISLSLSCTANALSFESAVPMYAPSV